ncbi:hypothetical protein COU19_02115 [Candidatus Kaiserbacteria bacterium CG10_big_fil_rev_8_21_14_0_10_56_12]|uniref:DUF218 domain-containing protein n=1 Tax=Candidatus Kaiserbacteria bacterium CG10_big_fil_rev_8_21_14_0_10_56_12 TaxID=1974611 RepID=A0A2H0U9V5_9BACT|nr:MAG: hypothetical protein COU19_02115 [Candidatus Kaiserbacteria bacterium CG10_big_fil_rev_8_21_14_0_10_56_12]
MAKSINRVVEADGAAEIAGLCVGILSIPFNPRVDALVVPPGMGETWRVSAAVRLWEAHKTHARQLFIAGANTETEKKPALTMEALAEPPYALHRAEGVEVHDFDENTVTQTRWVMERMRAHGLQSFGLCVSQYHLVRWYLTFLKTQEKMVERFGVYPMPTPISLDKLIPESGATPWDSVAGEVARIRAYQVKGDVATLPELKIYLAWLWEQPFYQPI